MKPNLTKSCRLDGRFSQRHPHGSYPRHTEQNYLVTPISGKGGTTKTAAKQVSFREISRSLSKREQFRYLAGEATAFVVLCLATGASLYVLATNLVHFLTSQ